MSDINKKFKNIKLLAMDFDGVMTDGKVYVDQDGREMVKCSRRDSLGIKMLKQQGLKVIVISKEKNPVVAARCKKLNLEFWQGAKNSDEKFKILTDYIIANKIGSDHTAYIGDDLNDLAVLKKVGLAITVADGHVLLKEMADYITEAKGGDHAVREVCEKILIAQGVELTF